MCPSLYLTLSLLNRRLDLLLSVCGRWMAENRVYREYRNPKTERRKSDIQLPHHTHHEHEVGKLLEYKFLKSKADEDMSLCIGGVGLEVQVDSCHSRKHVEEVSIGQ